MASLHGSKLTDLTGRVALVTGGGTGIGNLIARGLAANGAKVYITGRRKDVLEKAAAQAQSQGLQVIPLPLDVTDKDSIRAGVTTLKEKEGKLHILVNNAGAAGPVSMFAANPSAPERKDTETFGRALFEHQTFEQWKDLYQLNVASAFFVTSAFLGLLENGAHDVGEGETSSVVNISSGLASTHLNIGMYCYGVTKAALNHLTGSLATEYTLLKIPVRVNAIAAGYFISEATPPELEHLVRSGLAMPGTVSPAPTKRPGKEEEMTMAVLSLVASANYINGQVVTVDGGFSLVNP
ncbi:NAD P-binding protein [Gloeophyllum trabeum ATCC 11539]|uniref:NAD P-binding protein n=1 Tax=Gloeophyllum trabeum (strain ATCC 11539 / FP-39264 / Madison 617) TaxID=670483 RepID=S7Q0G3_GLOTA|nr:NAD P-binding protein [Gloeophyllum trabeum ATCC 11539]EPQ53406.1 NAD P-binding protein [Gloeophyllum trabeum ATCC 11539]